VIADRNRAARYEAWLWLAQRGTAAILALCVIVHLATIIYAVRGGLSAAEILGRTRESASWLIFYLVFVVAVSVHAPIGMRSVVREWTAWRGRSVDVAVAIFGIALAIYGARAMWGMFR
jgi:fumarate reductase subunit C